MKQYKATTEFSFDGRVYAKGDAIKVTDETALETLKSRKQITEGEGAEPAPPEGESMRAINAEREKQAQGPVPAAEAKLQQQRSDANANLGTPAPRTEARKADTPDEKSAAPKKAASKKTASKK